MPNLIPKDVQKAAKRGFIRTTFQGYAATFSGGIAASTIISLIQGEVDLVVVGVTAAVSLVSPVIAGAASYFEISSNGIPKDYEAE